MKWIRERDALIAQTTARFVAIIGDHDGSQRDPALEWTAGGYVCHVSDSLHQASHIVVIGRVLDVLLCEGETPSPLMYHQRRFTTVSPALFKEPS